MGEALGEAEVGLIEAAEFHSITANGLLILDKEVGATTESTKIQVIMRYERRRMLLLPQTGPIRSEGTTTHEFRKSIRPSRDRPPLTPKFPRRLMWYLLRLLLSPLNHLHSQIGRAHV